MGKKRGKFRKWNNNPDIPIPELPLRSRNKKAKLNKSDFVSIFLLLENRILKCVF